jgi:hypothetical protein
MPIKRVSSEKIAEKKCCHRNWLPLIMYVVLVLIIILSGVKLFLLNYQYDRLIDKKAYQVVFLSNGESYFGQLRNIGFKTYSLSDVYYLKYSSSQQEAEATSEEATTEVVADNYDIKLIHLGDQEFYKPDSQMIINKDQVVYWENLQADSEVMKFINNN